MFFKIRSIIPLGVILLLLLFVGSAYFYPKGETAPGLSDYGPPDHPFQMAGFRFESHTQAGRQILVESDVLFLSKKKIGFFRFGLMNEPTLSNAKIHIGDQNRHNNRAPDATGLTIQPVSAVKPIRPIPAVNVEPSPSAQIRTLSAPENSDIPGIPPSFSQFYERLSIPNLPIKRIAAIRIAPVEITYFNNGVPAVTVKAARAEIKPANKTILLQGSVEVVSENRTLKTEQLKYDPELNQIVSGAGVYTSGQTVKRFGGTFTSDLFLKNVNL